MHKKIQPQMSRYNGSCCRNYHFCPEQKIFSVAKIFQKVMKYFCSRRSPSVQRIFVNFARFLWVIKMRVALELIELARVLEKKMNIFHLRKIFQRLFWDGSEGE